MPDIEIFGPVSAGGITAALKSAPYAHTLTFIRNSKNVTDINGNAQSFVRLSATRTWPPSALADVVERLHSVIGVEISSLDGWHPQAPPVITVPPVSTG